MKMRGIVVSSICLFSLAGAGSAATRNDTMRIKILDSETQTVIVDDSGVPINCDVLNYDAYCHSSKTTQVTNVLVAQQGDRAPFRIACTVDTKWSKCTPLPTGESFDARREKRGLVVFYADDAGKPRKQLYALLDPGTPPQTTNSEKELKERSATEVESAEEKLRAAVANEPQAQSDSGLAAPAAVKCRFTSNPTGAGITVDGRYIGSTPSVVRLGTGAHSVTISTPGYGPWSRELTVTAESELTVNAILEREK